MSSILRTLDEHVWDDYRLRCRCGWQPSGKMAGRTPSGWHRRHVAEELSKFIDAPVAFDPVLLRGHVAYGGLATDVLVTAWSPESGEIAFREGEGRDGRWSVPYELKPAS